MYVIKAYYILNIKLLSKDKLSFIWALLLPTIFVYSNKGNIQDILELRFWWSYIIFSSYLFGIGIHMLRHKESGTLKTFFSIKEARIPFFIANLLTQITFSIICICLLNILSCFIFSFDFIKLSINSIKLIWMSIPTAFLTAIITIIKKVHVNTVSTLAAMVSFIFLFLLSFKTNLNIFNPLLFLSNTIMLKGIREYLLYAVVSIIFIVIGIVSIKKYSVISNETR
ncbi:hypothetical protein KQI61_21410 [Anaerocolumna aminovalerica]|uniref:hypothetical protein n=1 Tax=Anaerocolumna aminovalerica TaxID=1527 RepID=UPI001C0F2346|nr:hypothetical protein [Anaerocolumna aminovalerica]MBU5334725.1 hypothetical protein [Anaerocolumna aminovalerica]